MPAGVGSQPTVALLGCTMNRSIVAEVSQCGNLVSYLNSNFKILTNLTSTYPIDEKADTSFDFIGVNTIG